jgi:hypothetical protein
MLTRQDLYGPLGFSTIVCAFLLLVAVGCEHGSSPQNESGTSGPVAAGPVAPALDADKSAVEAYLKNNYQGQDPKVLKWHATSPINKAVFLREDGKKIDMYFRTREEAVAMQDSHEKAAGQRPTLESFEQIGATVPVEFQFTKQNQTYYQYSDFKVSDGKVTGRSTAITVGNDYAKLQQEVAEAKRMQDSID